MVGNSPTLMAEIVAIYMEETNIVKDAAGIVSSCVFQPITTDMTSHFTKNGGNALGLAGQGPLNRTCSVAFIGSWYLETNSLHSDQHRHLLV
jgi:hypothetical protein